MTKIKFIHASDLHIESPYQGISCMNRELGDALIRLGHKSYKNLIDLCIDEQADFLIISGDSFDSASGSLGAMFSFFNGLRRLEKNSIKVYIICGNHDPFTAWSETFTLPENVTLFSPDKVNYELFTKEGKPQASVYGISYREREEWRPLAREFNREDSAPFSIAVLHGTLTGRDAHIPYSPFDLSTIRKKDFDYWALGHVHQHEVISESDPLAVYPGNLQGRHFNETGEKGCCMVEVTGGKVSDLQFIPLSEVVFLYHSADITGVEGVTGLFSRLNDIKNEIAERERGSVMLRIELKGRTGLFSILGDHDEMEKLTAEINRENDYSGRFIYTDRIINNTKPHIDLEERKRSSDLVADLLNRFDSYRNDSSRLEELREKILSEIKSSRAGKYLDKEGESCDLQEVLDNAKWKCIGGLIPDKDKGV